MFIDDQILGQFNKVIGSKESAVPFAAWRCLRLFYSQMVPLSLSKNGVQNVKHVLPCRDQRSQGPWWRWWHWPAPCQQSHPPPAGGSSRSPAGWWTSLETLQPATVHVTVSGAAGEVEAQHQQRAPRYDNFLTIYKAKLFFLISDPAPCSG